MSSTPQHMQVTVEGYEKKIFKKVKFTEPEYKKKKTHDLRSKGNKFQENFNTIPGRNSL